MILKIVGVLATRLTKSNAPLGVFSVLEDPKDANAPDPNPNALDAPAVGEEMEDADGDIALKGFLLLCEELFPCLREKSRAGWSLLEPAPFVEGAPVDKESLLVLLVLMSVRYFVAKDLGR